MKLRTIFQSLALCLAFVGNSHAVQTNYGVITKIKSTTFQAYVYVDGLDDPFGCGNPSLVRFYWSTTNADKLWAMVLSAQMAGKKISFEGECVSGYLSVNAIYILS